MMTEWNQLSGQWATTLVQLLWQGSIAIGLIWAIGKLWPTMPASKRHWLWRLVYLKLFALMVWQTPVSLPLLPAPSEEANPAATMASIPIVQSGLNLPNHSMKSPIDEVSMGSLSGTEAQMAPASQQTAIETVFPNFPTCLSLLWALGVTACLYRSARAYVATVRLRKESQSLAGTAVHDLFVELCQNLRLRTTPRLLSHPSVPSPLVVGCLKPCIIIPRPSDPGTVPPESRLILLHELSHVTRKDLWWAWLRVIVESFTFFHPLIRIARHQWNLSQEMACDEAVVTRARVSAPSYQNALLKTLEQGHQQISNNNLLAVGASGSFRDMKERIIAMNRIKTHSPLHQLAVAALVTAIGFAGVIPYQLVAKSKKDSTENSSNDAAFDDLASSPKHKNQDGFNRPASHHSDALEGDIFNDLGSSDSKPILSPVIQGLSAALKSDQPQVRQRVVEALSELEDPAAIPVLIEALQDSNKEVRHEALHGLEQFGGNQAIDAVSELFKSDSWKVRNQAIEALEDFNHPKAIDVLIEGLKDPHHKNRLQAIDALEDHDHEVSIDVLHDSIHDDHWEVRKEVIEILGESGSPDAIKPLLHALADSHPKVRDEAFEALGDLHIPDIEAHVEHLIKIQPDMFADHAHELLSKVQKEKQKKERRHQRDQIKEAERQIERANQAIERQIEKNHQAAERQRRASRNQIQDRGLHPSLEEDRPTHSPGDLHTDFGSPFLGKPQDQAIQSIVESVLSQVNARVEEAIAKAMAELKQNNKNKDKSGLDPFADDSADGGDLFRNP